MKCFSDIEKIYCINLKKRTDRKQQCIELFNQINFKDVEFIEAKDGSALFPEIYSKDKRKAARIGCTLSHIDALQRIKEKNYKYSLILEDDFMCEKNLISKFDKYAEQIPNDFCILYLSTNHRKPPIKYSKNIDKCVKSYALHSYIVNLDYINNLLEGPYNDYIAIDVYISDFIQTKYPCYSFNCRLTWQRQSYSDLEQKTIFYKNIK